MIKLQTQKEVNKKQVVKKKMRLLSLPSKKLVDTQYFIYLIIFIQTTSTSDKRTNLQMIASLTS